ncbi:MAG: RNA 2',3'-cyclic phosphodiesterase [bacterium]|nr:RNA 2',3'-cyclic phosphodiesterase [bacterium]
MINQDKKRIFVAINFSQDIKKQIEDYKKEIQDSLSPELDFIFKWVIDENFHLTLNFLGNLSQQEIDKISEILEKISQNYKKSEIYFDKIVLGPAKNKPRLIWMEGRAGEELKKLKNNLDNIFLEQGFLDKKDIQKFIPHITLSRMSSWQWHSINREDRPIIEKDIDLKIPVLSLDLMESKLKRTGPEYMKIKSFSLV